MSLTEQQIKHTSSRYLRKIMLFLTLPCVDDVFDTRDGDGRLGDIGGEDAFPCVGRCGKEDLVVFGGFLRGEHRACQYLHTSNPIRINSSLVA